MVSSINTSPYLSIIIPTRERAYYLEHSLRSCTDLSSDEIEILVLDNASSDNTAELVEAGKDCRVSYHKSDRRLSMRDNFERGIALAKGQVLCFIGDDDAIFSHTFDKVKELFEKNDIEAIASNNARYYWPDTPSKRRNLALVSRKSKVFIRESISSLYEILEDGQYQRLPCMYYGFVKKSVYESVISKQGRFFLSNQPDVYSSIALSMEGIKYAFTELPLCMAGISGKSNGGRMFSNNTRAEYQSEWKLEDDIGFSPGFENWKTIRSLIIESAIVYSKANKIDNISSILNIEQVKKALQIEGKERLKYRDDFEDIELMFKTSGFQQSEELNIRATIVERIKQNTSYFETFFNNIPVDFSESDVRNVHQAIEVLNNWINKTLPLPNNTFLTQLRAAIKYLKNR